MLFQNRYAAGEILAKSLKHYQGQKEVVVIGLARGGVITAAAVAKELYLPLDLICPRKIGAPFNPEFAIGAITETGESVLNQPLVKELGVSSSYIAQTIAAETKHAQERIKKYRRGREMLDLENRIVLLVDDGLATGSTMKAAIQSMRELGVARVVVAIPVAPFDTLEEMKGLADEVVCLDTPEGFQAVGQFYEDFSQTEDEDVILALKGNLLQ